MNYDYNNNYKEEKRRLYEQNLREELQEHRDHLKDREGFLRSLEESTIPDLDGVIENVEEEIKELKHTIEVFISVYSADLI